MIANEGLVESGGSESLETGEKGGSFRGKFKKSAM